MMEYREYGMILSTESLDDDFQKGDVKARTVVVTVTYGNRFADLAQETIDRALKDGAAHVVVVDNGSSPEAQRLLSERFGSDGSVTIVPMGFNSGSAPGFGKGIEEACSRNPDFILLLDDDNWIAPGTIKRLQTAYSWARSRCSRTTVGVSGYRELDTVHRRIAAGMPAEIAVPPVGSFMFFDALTLLRRNLFAFHKLKSTRGPYISVPEAPYGGFLFPMSALEILGPPPSRLRLYADDTLWTRRATASGHDIFLDTTVAIHDADAKWAGKAGSGPAGILKSSSQRKLYYSVRNRVFLENSFLVSKMQRLRYRTNRLVYMIVLQLLSVDRRLRDNSSVFHQAVRAGESFDLSDRYHD